MGFQSSTAGFNKLPSKKGISTASLPALYAAKADKVYQEKRDALEERSNLFNQEMAKDEYDAAKKQNTASNLLGVGSLIGNVYAGNKQNEAANLVFGEAGKNATSVAHPVGTSATQYTDSGTSGLLSPSTTNLAGAGIGALLGSKYGEKLGIKDPTTAALAGAAAGYVAPAAYSYAAPIVSKAWTGASSWFGNILKGWGW